jgi:hypothetical protein
VHDLKIARTSGILNQLQQGERILADKAYIGEAAFLTPARQLRNGADLPALIDIQNDAITSTRVRVEHFFCRMRSFGVIANEFRGEDRHHDNFFNAVANIVCLTIASREE